MPRQRREKGETGLYHIMLRGIDRRVIFEDEEDDRKFLSLLERFKGECGFELPGYCLMSNHVHLLMREKEVPLPLRILTVPLEQTMVTLVGTSGESLVGASVDFSDS